MCGIVARVSFENSPLKTLQLLKSLEYRGYDSYGILLMDKEEKVFKEVGSLPPELSKELTSYPSHIELGHTRWATHGGVSKLNAHPHTDSKEEVFVVMNGIIENYLELKEEKKLTLKTESDTEIIPQLFAKYRKELSEREALRATIKDLEGEFSFVLKTRESLYAYKRSNPLIIGFCEKEILLCSDLGSLQGFCESYHVMEDEECCEIKREGDKLFFALFDSELKEKKVRKEKTRKEEELKEKTREYYMEEEIFEQQELGKALSQENLYSARKLREKIEEKGVVLVGAGTSYHAALYLHYLLLEEEISSQVIVASELEHYLPLLKGKVILALSQSGETADLIHPLKILKEDNEICAMTNTAHSTLDRMASLSLYLNCGKEHAVASTKAFTAQMLLSMFIAKEEEAREELEVFQNNFKAIIEKNERAIHALCKEYKNCKNFFFIGRARSFPLALEGALKVKEVSYLNAEGFAGGELKHGTLSLVEENTPVFVLGSDKAILSNAIEVKTRGGALIMVSSQKSIAKWPLWLPQGAEDLGSVLLLQLLAFHMALELNRNPDKPRNLAKSVTVK